MSDMTKFQAAAERATIKKPDAGKQRRGRKENMMTGGTCGGIDCENGCG